LLKKGLQLVTITIIFKHFEIYILDDELKVVSQCYIQIPSHSSQEIFELFKDNLWLYNQFDEIIVNNTFEQRYN